MDRLFGAMCRFAAAQKIWEWVSKVKGEKDSADQRQIYGKMPLILLNNLVFRKQIKADPVSQTAEDQTRNLNIFFANETPVYASKTTNFEPILRHSFLSLETGTLPHYPISSAYNRIAY